MVSARTSFKDQSSLHSIFKKLLPWAIYSILPIALLRFCLYPLSSSHSYLSRNYRQTTEPASIPPAIQESESKCDYTLGKWVKEERGPLYNGTTCSTIKEGQNCIAHGRPDSSFLFHRWQPQNCQLSRFDPNAFLRIITNKHIAFVGDSMARNQMESLLCLLATVSAPNLVYASGEDNKFRRWSFPPENATVSIYWSPFLVHGVEKSSAGPDHNELSVDLVDERWAKDVAGMDYIVLSVGHWFLHPAVYYEAGTVMGCHFCPGMNHTEIGFYPALRKALRTALAVVSAARPRAFLTTFSPSHFEGEWDKAGACPRTMPYEAEEKELKGMDDEIRTIEVEEVGNFGTEVEALDVTRLSLLRPDGHPGPYMNAFPVLGGGRVQNDCVHWCLPGPVDTWNEILLALMARADK